MIFRNKVAVITGGCSGIGKAIALALAKLGTDMVIADIDDEQLESVCREIQKTGSRVVGVKCDVSNNQDIDNLASQTIAEMGKVDYLFNNAGVYLRGYLEQFETKDWEWILGINVLGIIRGVRAFLPYMLRQGSGYIVNTASGAGFIASEPPNALLSIPYSTSKFAVVGYSEGLYGYLKPKGIDVSVLCPGYVTTKLLTHSRYVGGSTKEINDIKHEDENTFNGPGVIGPDAVAQTLIEGMREKKFLIITPPQIKDHLMRRGQDMEVLEKYLENTFTK